MLFATKLYELHSTKAFQKNCQFFLHNIGFYYNNRSFKLFTFSRIFSENFYFDKN